MKLKIWRVITPLLVLTLALLPRVGATPPAASSHPHADTESQAQCPTVRVSCPTSDVEVGAEPTFTAEVSGGDANVTPTFNWTVSAGTISSGQGTTTIKVETTGIGGQSITATVDVGGFARECRAESSCTISVLAQKVLPSQGMAYVVINSGEEKARLDRYALALEQAPSAQAYVITYGGRTSRPDVARKAGDRVRDHLVNTRGLDVTRIVTVDGGYREHPATELWIVPPGVMPPAPTPTVERADAKRAPAKPAAKRKPAPKRRRKS